jgi:hypothetical protein
MVRDSAPSVPVIVVMREFDGALGTPIREALRVRIAPRTFFEWGVRCD